jgi:hypothetical protein
MTHAAVGEKAVSWRRRLTGPVLLADRGADDAIVARRAAADVAARTGVPVRLVTAWEVPAMVRVTPATGDLDVVGLYESSARSAQTQVRHRLQALGSAVGAGYIAEGSATTVVANTADRPRTPGCCSPSAGVRIAAVSAGRFPRSSTGPRVPCSSCRRSRRQPSGRRTRPALTTTAAVRKEVCNDLEHPP